MSWHSSLDLIDWPADRVDSGIVIDIKLIIIQGCVSC